MWTLCYLCALVLHIDAVLWMALHLVDMHLLLYLAVHVERWRKLFSSLFCASPYPLLLLSTRVTNQRVYSSKLQYCMYVYKFLLQYLITQVYAVLMKEAAITEACAPSCSLIMCSQGLRILCTSKLLRVSSKSDVKGRHIWMFKFSEFTCIDIYLAYKHA